MSAEAVGKREEDAGKKEVNKDTADSGGLVWNLLVSKGDD